MIAPMVKGDIMNKILLIEDDSTIRMGIKYYLEEERI